VTDPTASLQTLLDLRDRKVRAAETALASARQACTAAEDRERAAEAVLAAAEARLAEERAELRQVQAAAVRPGEGIAHERFHARLVAEGQAQRDALASARATLDTARAAGNAARAAVVAARQAREVVVRYRDRAAARARLAADRRAEAEAEDHAAARWSRPH
jgi:hypothetical protein